MGTHCQTAARSGECQNLGAFGAKKGGSQLQAKNIRGALAHNSCLYSLYFIRHMVFFI